MINLRITKVFLLCKFLKTLTNNRIKSSAYTLTHLIGVHAGIHLDEFTACFVPARSRYLNNQILG